jgi:hypothetical protein
MDINSKNPASNILGSGVTEAQVAEAISKSGYPLQTLVVKDSLNSFSVEEEWSFIDADTGTLRTIDIHASRWL